MLDIEHVRGAGKLIAVAQVLVSVHDVEIVLSGCQVRITPGGRYVAQGPMWRHPRTGL